MRVRQWLSYFMCLNVSYVCMLVHATVAIYNDCRNSVLGWALLSMVFVPQTSKNKFTPSG